MGTADKGATETDLVPFLDVFPNEDVRPGAPTKTVGDAETRLNMMLFAVVWVVAQTEQRDEYEASVVVSRSRGRTTFWTFGEISFFGYLSFFLF